MAIISTGQLTIVDTNDAKPITGLMTYNRAASQVVSVGDSNVTIYTPDFTTSTLILTPKIYVAGIAASTDVSSDLTNVINRKWSKSLGAGDIWSGTTTQDTGSFNNASGATLAAPFTVSANGLTLTISGNLKESVATYPIYFECDYKDPVTTVQSHIIIYGELSVVKSGTDAAFIQFRGVDTVETSNTTTRGTTAVTAELFRKGTLDRSDLSYKWYYLSAGSWVQVHSGLANYATGFAISDTLAANAPTSAALGTGAPASGSGSTYNTSGVGSGNTITVSELVVSNYMFLKAEITDTFVSPNVTYTGYTTITDVSDTYRVNIVSSKGDKLLNGVGSTVLTPEVYYGGTKLTLTADWAFTWSLYDKSGNFVSFVDNTSTSAQNFFNADANGNAQGKAISSNTAGLTGVITFAAVTNAPTIGTNNIVKVFKDGTTNIYYYKITAATTTTVTLDVTASQTLFGSTIAPSPTLNQFANYTILLGTLDAKRNTTSSTGITITGADIDQMGSIKCEATKP